jgi:hypothetical protein
MKGYPYALVLVLFLCVVFSGCMGYIGFLGLDTDWILEPEEPADSACASPAVKVVNAVTGSGNGEGGAIDKDHCYQAVAVNLRDTELCKKIERAAPRSKCYLLIADKYSDPSVCSQMPATLESMDSYSQMECLQTVAIKMGDSSVCDQIGDRKIRRMITGEISREACRQYVASGDTRGRSI